jgi:Apea-like HEPN
LHYTNNGKSSTNLYKNNIALALDWYLESAANEEFDSKFLQMATALECLLNVYHEQHQSEYILSKSEFSSLRKKIVPEIVKALKDLGLNEIEHEEKFKTVEGHLQDLRRRTLSNKFRLMVDQLQIDYSDIPLKLGEIAKIRNEITHTGGTKYGKNEKELQEMHDQYTALWSVIIRIFFRLLNYNGDYYDPYLKSLISFANKA